MWDYPRPPAVKPCDRRVRVEWAGEVIADSIHALRVLETSHPPTIYIPPADVRLSFLTASDARPTWCEFKAKRGTWMRSSPGIGRTRSPGAAQRPPRAMRRCATTSRSIPGDWTPRGKMMNACGRGRATSTEDGLPAIWPARSKARPAPTPGSDSLCAELAAFAQAAGVSAGSPVRNSGRRLETGIVSWTFTRTMSTHAYMPGWGVRLLAANNRSRLLSRRRRES